MGIGQKTLEMILIWIMTRIIFYWDVFFTMVDNWQLRQYIKLKEKKQQLIEEKDALMDNYLNEMEEFKEWDDL